MIVVKVLKVVEDATFIHLNVATQSVFSSEEDNKTRKDMSLNFFIKN
jgi:hypothetical protein